MKVYIIDPELTSDCKGLEDIFFESLRSELDNYIEYSIIKNINFLNRYHDEIAEEDLLILFNGKNENAIDSELLNFINYVANIGAYIQPIALTKDCRNPITPISEKQAYYVDEQLRCRDFGDGYVNVLATIFARNEVITRVNPSIYSKEGMIFISHRRLDGEEITANLCDTLAVQYKNAQHFRDVTKVEVGENAQGTIDIAMKQSDAFVFLHTPEAGNSDWIKKELYFAIVRRIPVIWVQIDNASKDDFLFLPTESPHLSFQSAEFKDKASLNTLCDDIMNKTFEVIMNKNNEVFSNMSKIKGFDGINTTLIDGTNNIYSIELERKGYRYNHRNIRHIIQCFGRATTDEDLHKLKSITNKHLSDNVDSMILLSNKILTTNKLEYGLILENYDGFFDTIDKYLNEKSNENSGKEIVISGAFPDSEEAYKQILTDALAIFVSETLKKGYTLTFGSHPTFQELFFEISKTIFGESNPSKLKMYISKFFESKYESNKDYLKKNAIINETENHTEGIDKSLTIMRKAMIQRGEVSALICLGGKCKEPPLKEGVREEIQLAIEKNIPVFIVGTVGGCSSVVANEYKKTGWEQLNPYGSELNEYFKSSLDYKFLAYEMIERLRKEEVKDN